MQVRLEVFHKRGGRKRVSLDSDVVIGRSRECGLRIPSSEISRQHCKLIVVPSGVLVRDLDSSNGTFVNGGRIDPGQDVALTPGSRLNLGPLEITVFFDQSDVHADAPGSTVDLPTASESGIPEKVQTAPSKSPPSLDSPETEADPDDLPEDDSDGEETVVTEQEATRERFPAASAVEDPGGEEFPAAEDRDAVEPDDEPNDESGVIAEQSKAESAESGESPVREGSGQSDGGLMHNLVSAVGRVLPFGGKSGAPSPSTSSTEAAPGERPATSDPAEATPEETPDVTEPADEESEPPAAEPTDEPADEDEFDIEGDTPAKGPVVGEPTDDEAEPGKGDSDLNRFLGQFGN